MKPITDHFTAGVALVLAIAAAILSAPGEADRTSQFARWLQSGFGPEAAAMAGAIGEHPDVLTAP
jgi:hypothetical protein